MAIILSTSFIEASCRTSSVFGHPVRFRAAVTLSLPPPTHSGKIQSDLQMRHTWYRGDRLLQALRGFFGVLTCNTSFNFHPMRRSEKGSSCGLFGRVKTIAGLPMLVFSYREAISQSLKPRSPINNVAGSQSSGQSSGQTAVPR